MKDNIRDFRRYRTYDCLVIAMLKFCDLVKCRGERSKGICPHRSCVAKKHRTCVLYARNTVAYCYACHRSMDALEIASQAMGTGYFPAMDELEILCASALQCHT